MCLTSIKEKYDNPSAVVQSGFKDFTGSGKALKFVQDGKPVEFDKWLAAKEIVINADDKNQYTTGFHVYVDEIQIKKAGTGPKTLVYYRYVHTLGSQSNCDVIVAKELYVPSNKNNWPPTGKEKETTLMDRVKSVMPGTKGNA